MYKLFVKFKLNKKYTLWYTSIEFHSVMHVASDVPFTKWSVVKNKKLIARSGELIQEIWKW